MNFLTSGLNLSLVSLLLQFAVPSYGFEPADATVKIYSGLCNGDRDQFRGSGLAFLHEKSVFILTSEHVVLHANQASSQPICSRIWNQSLGDKSASLVQADWGTGLALLKMTDPITNISTLPLLGDLAVGMSQSGESAATFGYPFLSQSLFMGKDGVVLNAASDRAFIPMLQTVVELSSSHGEFGMSGGPIFSGLNQQFIGVLSHQFVEYVAGGSSRVGEYQMSAKADHVFAISQRDTVSWLQKILERPEMTAPSFVRDASLQLANINDVVFSSGLEFKLIAGKDLGSQIGGAEGHGIGGAEGHGIGGAEGNGIGGAEGTSTGDMNGGGEGHGIGGNTESASYTAVEISLDLDNHLAQSDFFGRGKWIQNIKAQLVRNHRLIVPFFVENLPGQTPKKRAITSLPQFFALLRSVALQPASVVLDGIAQDHENRDQNAANLKAEGLWLKDAVTRFQSIVSAQQIGTRQYLVDLKLMADILATGDWPLVDIAWVRSLENRQDALKQLINLQFDESVELIQHLKKVEVNLAKILVDAGR